MTELVSDRLRAEREDKRRGQKFLLWLSIGSMAMIFAGLTSAQLVRENQSNWFNFEMPVEFWISTALLIISSGTMFLSVKGIKSDNRKQARNYLLLTLILGIVFSVLQFIGWSRLADMGIYFVDSRNVSGSFFIVITGLHLVHLAGGLIALIVTMIRASLGKYSSGDYLGLQLCAIYWHFLDILWVYLFLFLLIKG